MVSIRGEFFIYPTEIEHFVSDLLAFWARQMRNSDVIIYLKYKALNKYLCNLEHFGGNANYNLFACIVSWRLLAEWANPSS